MKNLILICLFALTSLSFAAGYEVGVRVQLRDCQRGEGKDRCSTFAWQSFQVWKDETVLDMEAQLSRQLHAWLSEKQAHWRFVEESKPVLLILTLENEHEGIAKTDLVLRLKSLRTVEILRETVYEDTHFVTSVLSDKYPERELGVMQSKLGKMLEANGAVERVESALMELAPVAREHHAKTLAHDTVVLPLPKQEFEHLGRAEFRLYFKKDAFLQMKSQEEWDVFPDGSSNLFDEALVLHLHENNQIDPAGLAPEVRASLARRPIFLVSYEIISNYAGFEF